ncbi:MAG: ABC transporter permease, partial [Acidobacteriota bacterium]
FTLTNTMLLRALPYPDGGQLVNLSETMQTRGFDDISLAPLDYLDWREQQQAFTDIAGFREGSFALLSGGDPERVDGSSVTASLFDVLGVEPAVGRVFTDAEDRPGGERVVVLSDGLWRGRFGADPDLVGSAILLDNDPYTVIGIMPPDFNFPDDDQLWVPIAIDVADTARSAHNLAGIGRLRDGVGLEQAWVELSGIAARLEQEYPDTNEGVGVFLQGYRESEIGDERILVYVLSGVVGFVLLIACANVANLTLARAGGRRQELAVRAALGAGRGRLMRQLLTESLVLAAVGGVLGMFIGAAGKNLIVASFAEGVPTWMDWSFDANVYAFLVAVTLLTGGLFGFVPALQASRGELGATLRSTGRAAGGRRRTWLRGGLVIAEVALAMILLIGAGLMVRAYINVNAVNPGFDADDLVTMAVALPAADYPEADARSRFFEEMVERTRAVPGVEAAAATTLLPVGSFSGTYFGIEGDESSDTSDLPVVTYAKVTPGYFSTLGIPLIAGRVFERGDGVPGTPEVLLVTRSAAQRFWPDDSPLGKRVKFGPVNDPDSEFKTVIGVVDDVMQTGIGDPIFPGVYIPVAQSPSAAMTVVVRARGGPSAVVPAIREQVWQIDDALPVFGVSTMRERIARDDWEEKLFTRIFAAFAVIALVLAAVGLYGLVSYSVTQRTREIGVRMALGADRGKVVRMVVRQGLKLTAVGLVLGLLGSWGVTRVIAGLLFGVSPTDPLTFGGIFAVLAAVAVAASYLPARRATRVDPVTALREQ